MEGRLWFFLLAVLNCALAEDKHVYVALNDTLVMKPRLSEQITTILWKHEGNLLAEWDNGNMEFFGDFKGRTNLDSKTGEVKIKSVTSAQSGLYTTEINNNVQKNRFKVSVIQKVPEPEIVVKPLACSKALDNCTLHCDKATGEYEPVTYEWKDDDGEWVAGTKEKLIKKDSHKIKTFSCKLKNPVSERVSGIFKNPFYYEFQHAAVITVIVILPFLIAGVILYLKRESIRNICANDTNRPKETAPTTENEQLDEAKSNSVI
ncbi:uncharacterized protein LOC115055630 [Echeneis naucrates]|uniref:Uncharacterized LOC115055630 n=1 Tax=Echeneis naucrates TaxID=173247 RepID=A0A665VPA9_ECHNA|nr:uncharacterized protein LOC115055630 [Echeneis naucrates]